MLEIAIFIFAGLAAVGLVFGLRALAARYADGMAGKARVRFAELEGFTPDRVAAFGRSAIAVAPDGVDVALLAEDGSVHRLDRARLAGWYAGMVNMHEDRKYARLGLATGGAAMLTEGAAVRTAWAPYLFLFEENGAVWFRLGFATEKICEEWRDLLVPVLGEDIEQATPHLQSGAGFDAEDEDDTPDEEPASDANRKERNEGAH